MNPGCILAMVGILASEKDPHSTVFWLWPTQMLKANSKDAQFVRAVGT